MIKHTIWAEKYRPQTPTDFISTPEIKSKVESYIANNDIPHLLLAGQVGSGKTTLAKLLINQLNCDYLMINASDENGVETIRTKIKSFASSASFKPIKIVILDEADFLTPAAQASLRNIIETFAKTTRFILTCNYFDRLIEPLHSRCIRVNLEPPAKVNVATKMVEILDAEGIKYENKDVAEVITKLYPDIRSIVNSLQEHSNTGKLIVPKIFSTAYQTEILELLKSKKVVKEKWSGIRQIIVDNDVRDFESLYRTLYETYFENPEVVVIIGEWQYKHALVPDREINFMCCIKQIIEIK